MLLFLVHLSASIPAPLCLKLSPTPCIGSYADDAWVYPSFKPHSLSSERSAFLRHPDPYQQATLWRYQDVVNSYY